MKKLNKWEQIFWDAFQQSAIGKSPHDLQPRFCVDLEVDGEYRNLEFDFGSPSRKVLVECDGLGGFNGKLKMHRCGAHQTPQGMREDSAKRNAAVLDGWRVLVFPSSRLDSKSKMDQAVDEVCKALAILEPAPF